MSQIDRRSVNQVKHWPTALLSHKSPCFFVFVTEVTIIAFAKSPQILFSSYLRRFMSVFGVLHIHAIVMTCRLVLCPCFVTYCYCLCFVSYFVFVCLYVHCVMRRERVVRGFWRTRIADWPAARFWWGKMSLIISVYTFIYLITLFSYCFALIWWVSIKDDA